MLCYSPGCMQFSCFLIRLEFVLIWYVLRNPFVRVKAIVFKLDDFSLVIEFSFNSNTAFATSLSSIKVKPPLTKPKEN